MRILYVTNYQGPSVLKQRGHRLNRALGASRKVELLARGLQERGNYVHVVSAGTVRESTGRWYPGFRCQEVECGTAQVTYLPTLDVPRVNLLVASRMLRLFLEGVGRYDAVLLYNLEWFFLKPTVEYARVHRTPLVVEYEDDALSDIGVRLRRWHMARGRRAIDLARQSIDGAVAVSPELVRQLGHHNAAVLPGVVGEDSLGVRREVARTGDPVLRLVYTGGMSREKGPDLLAKAAQLVRSPVEVDITGGGSELQCIRALALSARVPVRVHGEVGRREILGLLERADLAINPHRMGEDHLGQIFPFKIVEYIGAGLPVVTSRFGEFPLPMKDSLVVYEEDSPECLAQAIDEAASRIAALRQAAGRARSWVASEYSGAAAGRKVEEVLGAALERRRAIAAEPA